MTDRLESRMQVSAVSALLVAFSMALSACAPGAPLDEEGDVEQAASAISSGISASNKREPVIFDTDMDFDDSAALAYLAQSHKLGHIELRAVTVSNNGAGFPGRAIRHARCLLQRFGLSNIPVADGANQGTNTFPIELRGGVEQVLSDLTPDCTASEAPSEIPAEQLIADTIDSSRDAVTVLTTGPLTNVANALRLRQLRKAFGRPNQGAIGRVVVMGGAVRTGGNLCCGLEERFDNSQEMNIWGDPAAAQMVFQTMKPGSVTLVPLDATQYAPVTGDFIGRLSGDHRTAEADYVLSLTQHPFIGLAVEFHMPIFWWDPLAAVGSTNRGVVEYEWNWLTVVQSGAQQGRTALSSARAGGARVRVGVWADQSRFESLFLNTLNGRQTR